MTEKLLEVEGVTKVFESGHIPWRRRRLTAVDDVSLELRPGETLGVVGESGSGKSTLLRIVLDLIKPNGGRVLFQGREFARLPMAEKRAMRRQMQAVFQDPWSAFNPRHNVRETLLAPLEVHGIGTRRSRVDTVVEALQHVGLDAAFLGRYLHQLSGGQRQRIAIARAIVLRPSLVVADEPTSALDVSVQAQILNLFKETKRELGLTYLFVSHNLGVIRYVSDRVAVMRKGRIIETGSADEVFTRPKHAYTQALLDAVPELKH